MYALRYLFSRVDPTLALSAGCSLAGRGELVTAIVFTVALFVALLLLWDPSSTRVPAYASSWGASRRWIDQ